MIVGLGLPPSRRASARREGGFALLLVFLMAATIAITLYWQIPRVAFQAQRQKEQLLIERGEQYQRAVQLFVRANNRYPQKLDDLENFNNRRFLRHKFKDPITGKDEWRLIHVNAAGVFTDSIANKKKSQQNAAPASQNTFVGEQAFLVPDAAQQNTQGANAATRRRQSEGGAAPVGPDGQPLIPPPNQQAQNAEPGAAPPPFPGGGGQLGVSGQPLTPGAVAGGNPNAPYPGAAVSPGAVNNLNNAVNNPNSPGLPYSQQPPGTPPQPGFNPVAGTGTGTFAQPGGGAPGGVPTASGTSSTSSFVGSSSSFVGGSSSVGASSSFVGGSSFVGDGTSSSPTSTNPNGILQPGNNGMPGTQPGLPQPGLSQPGFSQPGASQPGFNQPGQPGFAPQGGPQQNYPSTPQQNQQNFAQPAGQSNTAATGAVPGFQGTPGQQNAAANMINNILTGPRPGGIGGDQSTTQGPQGQQIGAGIAGVASTSEAPAIMVYNDNKHYNEWEFIFDITKQKQAANPNGVPGTPAQALGTTPGGTPGTPVALAAQSGGATATASPFGASAQSSSPFGTPGQSSSPFGITTAGPGTAPGTSSGTPGQQTTPGGAPVQQQSPIPPWFRFGEP
jgi:hypothetical protein